MVNSGDYPLCEDKAVLTSFSFKGVQSAIIWESQQSGCPQHWKFISGYAEGHDMLYKHAHRKAHRFESTFIERVSCCVA